MDKYLAKRLADDANYRSVIGNEVINYLKRASFDGEELGGPPHILVVRNGRINLEDGSFVEGFDPEELQIVRVDVEFDEEVTCSKIEKFLSEVLESEDKIKAMVELIGYCLFKGWPYDIIVIMVGGGANGKTVWIEAITEFLGKENIEAMTMQTLAKDKFALANLHGKLANLAGEIPHQPIAYTSRLKDLTGGGRVFAQKKYQTGFHFENWAKLFFSSNNTPAIYDDSRGMWRRMFVLNFPNTFGIDDRPAIPRDRLVQSLTTEDEFSGLLNLAIAGWLRLRESGKLTGTKTPEEERVAYLRVSNPLQYLAEFFLEFDRGVPPLNKPALYEVYLRWCAHEGQPPKGERRFFRAIRAVATYITEKHPTVGGQKVPRIFESVRIKTEDNQLIVLKKWNSITPRNPEQKNGSEGGGFLYCCGRIHLLPKLVVRCEAPGAPPCRLPPIEVRGLLGLYDANPVSSRVVAGNHDSCVAGRGLESHCQGYEN